MPQIVEKDMPAAEVKAGYVLFGEEVTARDPKRVNIMLTLKNPVDKKQTWWFKKTDMLTVGVPELTEEELEQKRLEHLQFEWELFLEHLEKGFEQAKDNREAAVKAVDTDWLRYSEIDELIIADAALEAWNQINDFVTRGVEQKLHRHEPGVECEYTEPSESGHGMRCVKPTLPSTAQDGARAAVEWLVGSLFKVASNFRATSRSTSVMSNYMEDVKLQTWAKILDNMRWRMPHELRETLPEKW